LSSAEASHETGNASDSLKHGSGNVLIVDDQELASEVASDYLLMLGYTTFCCIQAVRRPLEFYANHINEIDLVLLDMIMPGMSGSETFAVSRN